MPQIPEKLFEQLLKEMNSKTGVSKSIIEKDYWVTKFLQVLSQNEPNIIFKGGTSLSKCHKVIRRFSEDVDINLESADEWERPSEGERRKFKSAVIKTAEQLNLEILNLETIRSKRYFNAYNIQYPTIIKESGVNEPKLAQNLIVETAMQAPSFPNISSTAGSYIYDYLEEIGAVDVAREFELEPFEITVQSLERTFVDKVFALCDYYIDKENGRISRHIYDIHCIFPRIAMDDDLLDLIDDVRELRRGGFRCHSADPNCDVSQVIREMLASNYFKDDYNNLTATILYPGENLPYEEATETLRRISEQDYFCYRGDPGICGDPGTKERKGRRRRQTKKRSDGTPDF